MPRQMRKLSDSGVYHVMLRGINRHEMFKNDIDKRKFLQVLIDCKGISGFKLYAYCVMNNHVHLLIQPEKESLQTIFRRVGARYVYWYNLRYERVGHLFQDRFRSEPITDDAYFLDALRYIINNPVKAGICNNVSEYYYSSYGDYKAALPGTLTDTQLGLNMIGEEHLDDFLSNEVVRKFIDVAQESEIRLSDDKAQEIVRNEFKSELSGNAFSHDMISRCRYVSTLKSKGLSLRQIAMFTGLTKSEIETAIKHIH